MDGKGIKAPIVHILGKDGCMKKNTADLRKILMSLGVTVLVTGTLLQIIATMFLVSYAWLSIAVIFMLVDTVVYCALTLAYERYEERSNAQAAY